MSQRLTDREEPGDPNRMTIPSIAARNEENLRVSSFVTRRQARRQRALLFTLTGRQQGAVFPLQGEELDLGRDPSRAVNLDDEAVSREHARLVRRADGIYLEDAGSTNGTFLNEERVSGAQRLEDGDHIRLGNTTVRFSMVDELEERALTNLVELTVRDPLTRAYNRRFLTTHLRSELAFAGRQGIPISLLLVDIDHFKLINDTYGHARGDLVLQLVANAIGRLLRPYDALCRYGGEEFVIVARDATLRNAEVLAERVRRQIEGLRFDVDGRSVTVTVSVGVTTAYPAPGTAETESLLLAVDMALYEAKASGRNCTRSQNPPAGSDSPSERSVHTAPPQPASSSEPLQDLRPPALPRFG
ncbi:MAG: diguanylate cyclase [Polyangiaceae bacterium]|jgi:diguanylate cyclase (GGDEF)-like protein|nr:diguanylate cyclase [Polyangiaceae bacterium]